MRVLYLSPDRGIPVFGRKGCSTHVRETCRALARRGHEVVLVASMLTLEAGDRQETEQECGFVVAHLPHYKAKWLGADMRCMLYNYRLARACGDLLRKFSPDLVYERYALYGSAGGNVAQRAGVPHMLEVNTRLADEQAARLHFQSLARMAERRIWRSAQALVAVSTPVSEEIASEGIDRERLRVMPMAVDTERFKPRARFHDHELPEGPAPGWTRVVYTGSLTAWHGTDRFFDFARRLRDERLKCGLRVIGGMPEQVALQRQRAAEEEVEELLEFPGSVPYADVPKHLAAADIGFLPRTSPLSSPTKLFEYMASGLAILAPRQPAIEEVVRDGENGLLFEPGNLDSLMEALRRLVENPSLREELGNQARLDAVDKHSWDRNAADIETFRGEIVERGWI